MRFRMLSVLVALAAAVVVVGSSGAVTAKERGVAKIDVSTTSGVIHYLRSIHLSPRKVVIQRGLRNYAGAHCPGKGWTCARTKHTVVQIAKQGGQNRFVCKSSKCVVVQISGASHGVYVSGRRLASTAAPNKGGGNSGVCVKTGSGATTGGGQTCTISQVGSGLNTAVVYENTQKVSGLTQTAQYGASITQTSSGAGNKACVTQNINLDGSTSNTNGKPTTVNLQAYQWVTISQDSLAGANSAQFAADSTGACTSATLAQSQTLTSTVTATGSITQWENQPANGANVNIDIKQNQSPGFKCTTPTTCPSSAINTANFQQTMNQQAVANSLKKQPVTQTQSSPDDNPPFSGLVGAINQDTNNQSIANATQIETQCEDAAVSGLTQCSTSPDTVPFTLAQTQYGPEGIFKSPNAPRGRVPFAHKTPGDSAQTGGTDNKFNVTQNSTQNTDTGSVQKNTIVGGITTTGTGTVTQNAFIQGNHKQDVQQGDDTTVNGFINCNGSTNAACHKSLSAPVIDPNSEPDNPSFNPGSADFSFSNVDTTVKFVCSLNGSAYSLCDAPGPGGSGSQSYSNLAPGTYTFNVKSQDPDNLDVSAPSSFTWTVLPLEVSALGGDGSSAGWACQPGGPIALTVGTDTSNTYAQVMLDDAVGVAITGLPEPTFTTDNYAAGSPRWDIFLSNGDFLFGYPPNSGLNGSNFGWAIYDSNSNTDGVFHPWSDVLTAESGTTVTEAEVIADGDQSATTTDKIGNLQFNGTTYNSGTCSP